MPRSLLIDNYIQNGDALSCVIALSSIVITVKTISKIEYMRVKTKLKMNKANDLGG